MGLPVVMIPDDPTAQDIIRAKGWLQVKKSFTLDALNDVMQRATGARDAVAGSG